MNRRTLERVLATLGTRIDRDQRDALTRLSVEMEDHDFFITGHDEVGGVFHVTYTDDKDRLTYSIHEVMEHASRLDAGRPFPWAVELEQQGNR